MFGSKRFWIPKCLDPNLFGSPKKRNETAGGEGDRPPGDQEKRRSRPPPREGGRGPKMLEVKRCQIRCTLKYVQRTTLNYIKNEFGKRNKHERAKKKQVPFFKTPLKLSGTFN